MAAINYQTGGINGVIALSLKLHPQLLVDCVRSHARVHAQFADAWNNREVMRSELDLADRLHAFANAIELGDTMIPNDDDVRVRPSAVRLGCKICSRSCRRIAEREVCGCVPRASISSLQQSVSAAGLAGGQRSPVLAPRSRVASGAPGRGGASHAKPCKSAVKVIRAEAVEPVAPAAAP